MPEETPGAQIVQEARDTTKRLLEQARRHGHLPEKDPDVRQAALEGL